MTDPVIDAAQVILDKWKAAYTNLLLPGFDSHAVFGEHLERADIQALDEAVSAATGKPTRWMYA